MEQQRFDRLSRIAGTIQSRRKVAQLVVATAVGGGAIAALDKLDPSDASAKKKKCKPGQTRCGKKCRDLDNDPRACGSCNNACAFDISCSGGTCICRSLDAACETDGQCCSGKCSTVQLSTCRKSNCKQTGACASNSDCCGGLCNGGCCLGVC